MTVKQPDYVSGSKPRRYRHILECALFFAHLLNNGYVRMIVSTLHHEAESIHIQPPNEPTVFSVRITASSLATIVVGGTRKVK